MQVAVEGKGRGRGVSSASTQQALRGKGRAFDEQVGSGRELSERALERNETALAEAESQKTVCSGKAEHPAVRLVQVCGSMLRKDKECQGICGLAASGTVTAEKGAGTASRPCSQE